MANIPTTRTFTTYELIDTDKLEYLLHSFKLRVWDGKQQYIEDYKKQYYVIPNLEILRDICKNGKVEITYTLDGYGRYKNNNGISGYSYTNMFGVIRNLLANKYYTDIDISNCHPVIIYNLCLIHKIPTTHLKYFIENREKLLKEIVDNNPEGHMNEERIEGIVMDRNVAKRFCLTMFFGASLKNMKTAFNIDDIPKEINDLYKELQVIIETINNLECFKPIVEYVKEKKADDTENIRGSIFSHIIQTEESNLFDILKLNLEQRDFTIGAYIYDGCHVLKDDTKKLTIKQYLNPLSKILTKYFNIENAMPIVLTIKDMELDNTYLETQKQYELYQFHKKQMIKDNVFKINHPFGFHYGKATTDKDTMPIISQEELIKVNRNTGNIHLTTMKKPMKFIDMWLDDKFIKTYDRIIFEPNPNTIDYKNENFYNKFDGIDILKHKFDDLPTTQEERLVYCKTIFDYLKKICMNEHNFKWITVWISSILSKPWVKTGVVPMFKAKKTGVGKTTLFYLLQKIIGSKYCLESSNLENDIFGTHSMGRVNKILVLLDEVSYKQSCKYTEQLKTAITSDTMVINPKNISPSIYNSYENYMGCSNNDIPLELNDDNRRIIIIDLDTVNYGTPEEKEAVFTNLYDTVIGSPKKDIDPNYKILRCFYDYMVNYDTNNYNLEANVNTASTLSIARKPIVEEFLNDNLFKLYEKDISFTENDKTEYMGVELYSHFTKYCERCRIDNIMNANLFGTKIKKFEWIESKKTNKGIKYVIDTKKYCDYFNYSIDM